MTEILPLYDKSMECIMCQKAFKTKKIRSRFIKVLQYDTDFQPLYDSNENNPLLYHINVCPHCGFSSSDEFSKYFPPSTKEHIEEKVCKQWSPHDFGGERLIEDALKTYKLAAYCGTLKKEKHITLAGILLRLVWLNRTLQNDKEEQRFLKLALKEYSDSYMADDFRGTQVSDVKILYLIGELSRRVGEVDQAIKYFSKVIEKQNSTIEKAIVQMARERWYEIREAKKEMESSS